MATFALEDEPALYRRPRDRPKNGPNRPGIALDRGAPPALSSPRLEEESALPWPVALLDHPAGAYAVLVAALGALVHACHTRTFVPAFTAVAATALTALAFLHRTPDATALAALVVGIALLHAEFLWSTYGLAALLGLSACACGSWQLLAPAGGTWPALPATLRIAAALLGSGLLLAAVLRGMRVSTLPREA
jgi:hypothetical protein